MMMSDLTHNPINRYTPATPFRPHPLARGGDRQTLLARWRPKSLITPQIEQPLLLDAGPDATGCDLHRPVRLLGYYTPSLSTKPAHGLVLILHGWEGCSHSVYNLVITDAFIRLGYDVFRLNMRDHGPNLHLDRYALNRGLFLGTLFNEADAAVRQIALLAGNRPFYIVGASMGGNFALRLAAHHTGAPYTNLRKVIAVNPAMNPTQTTARLDAHPVYRHYFRKHWLRSLLCKQQLFPDLYDFRAVSQFQRIRDMTECLIKQYGARYGGLQSADQYFAAYTVYPATFTSLRVPTTIISSEDDALIAPTDFYTLPSHPLLKIHVHPTGGHVGYVDLFPIRHHLPKMLIEEIQAT